MLLLMLACLAGASAIAPPEDWVDTHLNRTDPCSSWWPELHISRRVIPDETYSSWFEYADAVHDGAWLVLPHFPGGWDQNYAAYTLDEAWCSPSRHEVKPLNDSSREFWLHAIRARLPLLRQRESATWV